MSSKRSAVKPSECENVSKKKKKNMQGPHPGLYQRSTISALYYGQKVNGGALHWC